MIRESLNHQIKHLVSMQYSTVELRHQALEDVLAGPDRLHARPADEARRGQRVPQAVHRRPARGRPRRLPAGAPQEAAAQGPATAPRSRPARASWSPPAWRRCASCKPRPRPVAGVPRGGGRRDGRQVVPPGALRLRGRLDERRHLGRALPARPRAVPRADRARRSRSTSGCAASGRGWPRSTAPSSAEITSPEAWDETFRPWTDGEPRGRETRPADDAARRHVSTRRCAPPSANQGLLEVFRRRYLLRLLVRREISARYQGSFLGLLWSYINPLTPVLHLLLRDGVHPQPAQERRELRHPHVRGPDRRALLHRDVQRRHPLDRAQQGAGAEDGGAAGDVPGGLDAGLALPRRSRSW